MFRIRVQTYGGESFSGLRSTREGAERFAQAVDRLLRDEGVGDGVRLAKVVNEGVAYGVVDEVVFGPGADGLVEKARSRGIRI